MAKTLNVPGVGETATGPETDTPNTGQTTAAEPPIFTADEIKAASLVIDKIVQRALFNAVEQVVRPAIAQAFVKALGELSVAAKKPGGGQEGGGSSEQKQGEGNP